MCPFWWPLGWAWYSDCSLTLQADRAERIFGRFCQASYMRAFLTAATPATSFRQGMGAIRPWPRRASPKAKVLEVPSVTSAIE